MAVRKYSTAPIGRKFGHWTVLSYSHARPRGTTGRYDYWNCRCDCGQNRVVLAPSLVSGKSTSCGCATSKGIHTRPRESHGMKHTPEYAIWQSMLDRCRNPRNADYAYYGGRGISVCEEWKRSFMRFFKDMGPRPDGLTLDRANNNGNYEPSNCRWTTHKEQTRNRRPRKDSIHNHLH